MRRLAWLASLALVPLVAATSVAAQPYPSRPIQVIVPFSAGQSTDVIARAFVLGLAAELGQPVTVNNIPGASGILAFLKLWPRFFR